MVSAIGRSYVKPIYMASVAKLPHRLRSNCVKTVYGSGAYTIGYSQPPKVDKHFQPLEGINKRLDFFGSDIEQAVTVVRTSEGQLKVFKQKNIFVVTDIDRVTVFETVEAEGQKVSKAVETIEGGKHLRGYYLTKAGILIRPITKVSIDSREPDYDPDPSKLERIALDFEKAGNQPMAERFGDRYAQEILSGRHELENGDRLLVDGDDLELGDDTFMGLSDAINCHKSPPKNRKKSAKRGSKGITTKGRRLVTEACYEQEKEYGQHCLSFLTATLPAFANLADLQFICANWSDLIRKFIQELKRILERRGFPTTMVWVTEIQEDRYRDSGVVAPHLHLTMVGKKHRYAKQWAISKGEVRALWERLLGNLLDRPVTCQAATRVERPRKSLKAEMGKYMSKGGKVIKEIIQDGKANDLPSSYCGCSDDLRKVVKSKIKRTYGYEAQKFADHQQEMKEAGLLFYKPIIVYAANLGKEITVGFVGWIKEREIVEQFLAA
jgi:hypothetical protein